MVSNCFLYCFCTKISLGLKFCNSLSMYSALPCEVKNSPVEISKKDTPNSFFLEKCTAAKKLLVLACKISSIRATPGVTNSVTPRFTIVFVFFGSSN